MGLIYNISESILTTNKMASKMINETISYHFAKSKPIKDIKKLLNVLMKTKSEKV